VTTPNPPVVLVTSSSRGRADVHSTVSQAGGKILQEGWDQGGYKYDIQAPSREAAQELERVLPGISGYESMFAATRELPRRMAANPEMSDYFTVIRKSTGWFLDPTTGKEYDISSDGGMGDHMGFIWILEQKGLLKYLGITDQERKALSRFYTDGVYPSMDKPLQSAWNKVLTKFIRIHVSPSGTWGVDARDKHDHKTIADFLMLHKANPNARLYIEYLGDILMARTYDGHVGEFIEEQTMKANPMRKNYLPAGPDPELQRFAQRATKANAPKENPMIARNARDQILADYEIDKHGRIKSPGKFEGEMLYVPYLWDGIMEGGGDQTVYDGDTPVDFVQFTDEDLELFPEIGDAFGIALWESDTGFVNTREFNNEDEYNDAIEKVEAASEEEDEG